MQNIERFLQWNVAAIVFVGALLLAMGNQQYYLPIMAGAAAIFSLIFVDRLKWFVLNRFAANLVALLVAVLPLINFFDTDNQAQLISIAKLLIHLQIVLLLEKKTARIYWQLFVLSVLQVVVAAALRLDLQGGMIFGVYILLDFSGMILMLLHRDTDRVKATTERSEAQEKETVAMLSSDQPARILRAAPVAVFKQSYSGRTHLLSYLRQAVILTLMAVAFATFLFYSVRRTGETWAGASRGDLNLIGFNDSIEFNETGRLENSNAPVMRVRLLKPETREPMSLDASSRLYMRGATLHHYGIHRGVHSWNPVKRKRNDSVREDELVLIDDDTALEYVLQEVVLEPTSNLYLFTQFPAMVTNVSDKNRIQFDPVQSTISLETEATVRDDLRYILAIPGIRREVVSKTYPFQNPYSTQNLRMRQKQRDQLLLDPQIFGPGGSLEYVKQLGDEWAQWADDASNHRQLCELYERKLGDPGLGFSYSLDFTNLKRDKDLDPIVDFLKNHRQGHCEYFASALALLLRSQGIPARLVVGYAGGEYNAIGSFYEVQQQHAHVWVEAYLAPEFVTREMVQRGDASVGGAWIRLDPQPLGDGQTIDAGVDDSVAGRADDAFGFAQMLWDDFVVGLNAERQDKALFGGSLGTMMESGFWQAMLQDSARRVPFVRNNPQLSLQIVIGAVAIGILGIYFAPKRRKKRRRRQNQQQRKTWLQRFSPRLAKLLGQDPNAHQLPKVDFYERLEQVLAQHGFHRQRSSTPKEYIKRLAGSLPESVDTDQLCRSLESVVSAFYKVRFGEQKLSAEQRLDIDLELDRIESAFGQNDEALKGAAPASA